MILERLDSGCVSDESGSCGGLVRRDRCVYSLGGWSLTVWRDIVALLPERMMTLGGCEVKLVMCDCSERVECEGDDELCDLVQ